MPRSVDGFVSIADACCMVHVAFMVGLTDSSVKFTRFRTSSGFAEDDFQLLYGMMIEIKFVSL